MDWPCKKLRPVDNKDGLISGKQHGLSGRSITVKSLSALNIFISTWLVLPDYNLLQNLFEAINHAMTGQSTGGFSTFDNDFQVAEFITLEL